MKDFKTIYGRNRTLDAGLFTMDINLKLPSKGWKNILRKLKTFSQYCATVGVHQPDANKLAIRRYTQRVNQSNDFSSMNKKYKSRRAGVTHRMTIGKIAYQNEYGAKILVKEKFKTVKERIGRRLIGKTKWWHTGEISSKTMRVTWKRYSKRLPAKQQGYVLVDKSGKFIWHKKPGSVITIPARPFLRPIINEPDPMMISTIEQIMLRTFVNNGHTAPKGWKLIAQYVAMQVKKNIRNSSLNHPTTVQAKGSAKPLTDEQDRLYNAIKYKIYKGVTEANSKGYASLAKQFERNVDKLLDSAKKFERIQTQTFSENVTHYYNTPSISFGDVPKI